MDFNNFVFILILVNVFANEEQRQEVNEGQSEDELSKLFGKNFNLTQLVQANHNPILGPFRPQLPEFQTVGPAPEPRPTSPMRPLSQQFAPPKLNMVAVMKSAYKGCISLFEAILIMFTALFQDGGILAPNGLLSYLLGPEGAVGPYGILSQLLYWLFRKDGFLGPQGLLSVLIRGLFNSLQKLEIEGLAGIGYYGL